MLKPFFEVAVYQLEYILGKTDKSRDCKYFEANKIGMKMIRGQLCSSWWHQTKICKRKKDEVKIDKWKKIRVDENGVKIQKKKKKNMLEPGMLTSGWQVVQEEMRWITRVRLQSPSCKSIRSGEDLSRCSPPDLLIMRRQDSLIAELLNHRSILTVSVEAIDRLLATERLLE